MRRRRAMLLLLLLWLLLMLLLLRLPRSQITGRRAVAARPARPGESRFLWPRLS